jgi:ABC-type branched-subunit amino acid transport system substrate-binding protein
MSSWFDGWFGGDDSSASGNSQTAKGAMAPPPKAAPVMPVQAQQMPISVTLPKVKVGVLLPLSGSNSALGHAMLNAAQQAVFDAAASNFELMPRDTGGNEAAAAREAIAAGAQLLVGPLFAAQVPGVYKVASVSGVPVLTLSTDTTLAAPNLYVMGFPPGAQAERVAHFAALQGIKRFAALVPGNSYGALVGQAFQLQVAKDGGTIVALETYDPILRNTDAKIRELSDKNGVIEALFLPEGGNDLTLIAKQLSGAGFDPQKIHMLGTGLWDAPETGKQTPFVVGGWYAAPDPAVRQNFVAGYNSTYHEEPPRLATLAYDATALAAALAKRGAKFDQASLTTASGFAGLDGIFRLKGNGEVERGLAVLEIERNGSQVVDQAPIDFMGTK